MRAVNAENSERAAAQKGSTREVPVAAPLRNIRPRLFVLSIVRLRYFEEISNAVRCFDIRQGIARPTWRSRAEIEPLLVQLPVCALSRFWKSLTGIQHRVRSRTRELVVRQQEAAEGKRNCDSTEMSAAHQLEWPR